MTRGRPENRPPRIDKVTGLSRSIYVTREKMRNLEGQIAALNAMLMHFAPKPHWSEESQTLVGRLRGAYPIGPVKDGVPEFGFRHFPDRPPIQFEAAARIEQLEELEWHDLLDWYRELHDQCFDGTLGSSGPDAVDRRCAACKAYDEVFKR